MAELEKDRAVIKWGSTRVADEHGMNTELVDGYAADIARLDELYDVIVVTSGAVATGRAIWRADRGDDVPEPDKQSLATLGNDECFRVWKEAFRKYGRLAGSIQVTHHEIDDEEEGGTLSRVLAANRDAGIISIVNENDALSDIEIAALKYGGDNDGLATHIAYKIWATHVLFMTDVEGVLDEEGKLVKKVLPEDFTKVREFAGPAGKNDMRSKVDASIKAVNLGINAHIGSAKHDPQLLINHETGTHFIR